VLPCSPPPFGYGLVLCSSLNLDRCPDPCPGPSRPLTVHSFSVRAATQQNLMDTLVRALNAEQRTYLQK